jgi:hypothetical protein
MLLDTDVPLGRLYPDNDALRAAMVEIAQHRIEGREAAVHWSDHLRFLAADTTSRPIEESEAEEGDLEPCTCVPYPSISLRKDERQLMVTDPADLSGCTHYLAVSYCCASSAMVEYHGPPYSVRHKGIVGSPGCPSDLLRRVINFARECGLDYFWIDAECIQQDDPNDKEVGIQAMDIVYQMAEQSVAVLEVQINEQRHLDALGLLQECSVEEDLAPEDLKDLIEALEIILSDRWFERTWCLQESTSAARNMALLIRRDPTLHLPGSLEGRSQVSTDFELDLSTLQEQIPAWVVYQVDLVGETGDRVLHARGTALIAAWSSLLIPDVGAGNDCSVNHGGRPICDAAEALWYMSRRRNSIDSDRLAIFANLCEYNIRLDAGKLDRLGHGFSICVIVLAVLNGDCSLMAGAATYNAGLAGKTGLFSSDGRDSASKGRAGFSWNVPAELSVEQLLFWDKRQDSLRHKFVPSLSDKGLRVSGSLWHMDQFVDLSQVRESFVRRESEIDIARLLEDGPLGHRAPFEEARARLLLSFLCHLYKRGHISLAKRIWQTLRMRSSKSDLEVQKWNVAGFGEIVDIDSATVKWHSPIVVPSYWVHRAPIEPFHLLTGGLVHYLLTSILLHARLPIGRLYKDASERSVYDAIFDNASSDDMYLAPATNLGYSSPSGDRSWYPIAWRITQDINGTSDADTATYRCHGLVCGHWTAETDYVTEVRLL